jgi:uncharacterized protein
MALVRILIDGYSLLHNWPQLAPRKPRHSEAARDELIALLTRYQDATGTPITVFFDGKQPRRGRQSRSREGVEVLYSAAGQTADDLIERAANRFREYGEVLVVTDDRAERDTVVAFGGWVSSCLNFIQMVESALQELEQDIRQHNRKERNQFRRGANT